MSKTTGNRRFRTVNIDELDENAFKDVVEDNVSSGPDRAQVTTLLREGKKQEALHAVLQNPPYGSTDDKLRVSHQRLSPYPLIINMCSSLVTQVLTSFKSTEMDKAIQSLDEEDLDALMQYIYKGFNEPSSQSCAVLLAWHQKLGLYNNDNGVVIDK
ncbi:actin-related protein 2/3 complex subunit 5-C-like [Antedon mediterranea]|uniref:actin-related protein 2/3 complex subunit 5-C-like n=1 Tax=Antedon mediterranea TaxID=105859 RepID=UPI003AF76925